METPELTSIFVYGTLKRGQCRESCWPETPTMIQNAWVAGNLYGRSDYPAMTPGHDRVHGELWQFQSPQMNRVLKALDQVEAAPTLYRRITTEVFDPNNQALGIAWTYHYASNPTLDGFQLLIPAADGNIHWPR
ncbi:gamma-glutamylcyclotransferase [Rubripirellula sp.]|jgi:gamma-glutamylcyclotransferase (GGCT)/AIG2-like uncharacterized protein YtfP|nr:gamma-glutamylcyclotransferase [Planctomycetaceae bacterium]MDA9859372.1 gamma-glutamylcyclotransferase [Rubripirellula sp.]MDF1843935.1 gamma-glutamylcyclotransferase [Rubripirellula sp.]